MWNVKWSCALLVFPISIPIYSQVVFVSNLIPPFDLLGNLFLVVLLTAMQSSRL